MPTTVLIKHACIGIRVRPETGEERLMPINARLEYVGHVPGGICVKLDGRVYLINPDATDCK